jgi:hypothetical protein
MAYFVLFYSFSSPNLYPCRGGGCAVQQLTEALCYKPEGCVFISRLDKWDFSVNPPGRTMALG